MRILLDTNILIHREASKVVNPDIGRLFQWLDRTKATKIYHPLSIEEISGHIDTEVVETMKIKLDNYFQLKTVSDDTLEISNIRIDDKTKNDEIDTSLIKEVYNGNVDIIITEDRGIHRKAKLLGIEEKAYTIDAFIEKVTSENPELKDYEILSVRKEYFGNINLSDSFFNTFKEDYSDFETWFRKKCDEIAYICNIDDNIGAFLYLKSEGIDESYNNINPPFSSKRRLKIGTLKVTSTGYRLGERFLKIVFDNAMLLKVEEIYVTIFAQREEQIRLIRFLEDWGFKYWGIKTSHDGEERVYVRDFSPALNIDNPKLTFPYISRSRQNFIVPIYPQYHTELIPDSILNNETPTNFIDNEPHRNAIQKAYISRSKNRELSIGDLIVFYRTGGLYRGVTTTIGIVENVHNNIENQDQFIELCRKRSVFSDEELKEHWNYNPYGSWVRPFIVNFLYVYTFPHRLNMAKLIELGIIANVDSAPRGFEPITLEQFNTLISNSRTNESYFID